MIAARDYTAEEVAAGGTCYEDVLEELLVRRTATLVHGYPTGIGGDAEGQRYGHAWLEFEADGIWWCWDVANALVPRCLYYDAGTIDPAECRRYTIEEAAEWAIETEHSGPWGDVPEDVVFANDEGG